MDLKETIKEYLVEQLLWHDSDEILLDEIIFNVELLEITKEDIRENGIKIDVTRDPTKDSFFQKNRSIDIYQQTLKNIQSLFRSLILSPNERQKMKLELSKSDDEFDVIF